MSSAKIKFTVKNFKPYKNGDLENGIPLYPMIIGSDVDMAVAHEGPGVHMVGDQLSVDSDKKVDIIFTAVSATGNYDIYPVGIACLETSGGQRKPLFTDFVVSYKDKSLKVKDSDGGTATWEFFVLVQRRNNGTNPPTFDFGLIDPKIANQ
jgi:hypothetical protein